MQGPPGSLTCGLKLTGSPVVTHQAKSQDTPVKTSSCLWSHRTDRWQLSWAFQRLIEHLAPVTLWRQATFSKENKRRENTQHLKLYLFLFLGGFGFCFLKSFCSSVIIFKTTKRRNLFLNPWDTTYRAASSLEGRSVCWPMLWLSLLLLVLLPLHTHAHTLAVFPSTDTMDSIHHVHCAVSSISISASTSTSHGPWISLLEEALSTGFRYMPAFGVSLHIPLRRNSFSSSGALFCYSSSEQLATSSEFWLLPCTHEFKNGIKTHVNTTDTL